ncbi:Xaa-Pro peptidase family protein [Natroniella sulfidigena]|uniref:M24 family metallopeptidase n=1 Tax=Natroniella sulfidigena TaxID=723921 RepID=UPI00200A704E|nr:Xaa-Pro peptidase family protein [Natroniella sulfidigena]MCK8816816.1 Xaa-Pro peptidase family protein [Natroniella sulfidigena]
MEQTPNQELITRIEEFQKKLRHKEIDLAIIIDNINLYYFSGTVQAEYLCIPQQGEPVLLTRSGVERAKAESNLANVIQFGSSKEIPEQLSRLGIESPSNLGLEIDVVAYQDVLKVERIFGVEEVIGVTGLTRELRMIKSDYELQYVQKSATQLAVIPELIKEHLREGISELELSAIIEAELRKSGHTGLIRMRGLNNEITIGICAAGENALQPVKTDALAGGSGTYPGVGIGPTERKIAAGELIVFDYVNNYHGYHVDQTRLAMIGQPSTQIKELYQKMVRFQLELSNYLTVDHSWADIYQQSLQLAKELGVSEYYLGFGDNQVRFVGHGVGLELNEFPFLAPGFDTKLQAGMLVALEPKLLVPEIGLVGIENTYLITEGKAECLTTASSELIIV